MATRIGAGAAAPPAAPARRKRAAGPPAGEAASRRPLQQMRRPPDDRREVHKHVIAIGVDLFGQRTVMRPYNQVAAGEPANGVGQLKAPWGGLDRPLPWALTSLGERVRRGEETLPGFCGDLPGNIPQPAHGRWRNPRSAGMIRFRAEPGPYTVFVDDLDCSTHKVDIIKSVSLFAPRGNCEFVGGSWLQMPGSPDWRPVIERDVPYTEPKGWSLQPAPVVFGGQLILHDAEIVEILVGIRKRAADPGADFMVTNHAFVTVIIN